MSDGASAQTVGRYALYDEIASGGMASVHMGRLLGPVGFSRVVAVKRLHPAYAKDSGFVAMMLDEARLASRIRHPNVVPILDVVSSGDELLLVMEYVQGETLARLLRAAKRANESVPPDVAAAVVIDILRGLHAAHEARSASGEPLGIVHRDVSPQNIMVATDGSARLLDFGVAKAASRSQSTDDGQLKGKIGYIAPEQLSGTEVDRRVDVFAASIVAWECVSGKRLFVADDMVSTLARVMDGIVPSLREAGFDVPEAFEKAIERGLSTDPGARFQTAEEMAREVEATLRPASRERVGAWVDRLAGEALARRQETMRRIETGDVGASVAQIPVGISPDQSGKVPTLRATVMGDAAPGEDPGTFPSTMATQSILPPAPPSRSFRWSAVLAVAALALGALATLVLVNRRGPSPGPAAAGPDQSSSAVAGAPQVQPLPTKSAEVVAEPAESAAAEQPELQGDAAALDASPAPSEPKGRPAAKRPERRVTKKAKPGETEPAPPPVDPLVDQR